MKTLWSLRDVALVTDGTRRLHDVTVDVSAGVTAVLGYSGAGKTSFLNLLVGFEPQTSGTVNRSVPDAAVPVFWVPQNGGLWNHVTVLDHILKLESTTDSAAAGEWLKRFDLEERSSSLPAKLSQGERARLSVARALATDAAALVMDEPLAHVDPGRVATYFDVIVEHVKAGSRSLVFATHQPELVLRYADNVVCLDAGTCVFAGPVADLYQKPDNSRLATLLGPGNWISTDEFGFWLDHTGHAEGVLRPERLRVERLEHAGERRFAVVSSRCLGPISETTIRDETTDRQRSFVHLTSGTLQAGQMVRLSVLAEDQIAAGE